MWKEIVEKLKNEFQKVDVEFDEEIIKIMSSKTDDDVVFPPYIPFVGTRYMEFRTMLYATAQNIGYDDFRKLYENNIEKLTERLYYFDDFRKKYPEHKITFNEIDINPYRTGVLPALVGVFMYAKFGVKIKDLNEIHNIIALTNYYKFSLNDGKRDINPERELRGYLSDQQIQKYWEINDKLCEREIEILRPKFIITFRGRKVDQIRKKFKEAEVIEINDPAWILYGGKGFFSKGGEWWKKVKSYDNRAIEPLVEHYLNFISGIYRSKIDSVRIYLMYNYQKWLETA